MAADPIPLPLRDRTGTIIAFAVVDADQTRLREQTWHLTGGASPERRLYVRNSKNVLLHRVVLGVTPVPGYVIDHINGLALDNRRANLRVVTKAENAQNVRRRIAPTSSRYRNVVFVSGRRKPWYARVRTAGVVHTLGYFENEDEAGAVVEAWRRAHLPYTSPPEGLFAGEAA